MKFADYLLIEDATDERNSFDPVFLSTTIHKLNPKWHVLQIRKWNKKSLLSAYGSRQPLHLIKIYHQEDVSGFEYYFLEGEFGSAKIEMLSKEVFLTPSILEDRCVIPRRIEGTQFLSYANVFTHPNCMHHH